MVSSSARSHASGTGASRRFSPTVSKQSHPYANSAATGARCCGSEVSPSRRSRPLRLSIVSTRSSSLTRRWENRRSAAVGWTCHTSHIFPCLSLNVLYVTCVRALSVGTAQAANFLPVGKEEEEDNGNYSPESCSSGSGLDWRFLSRFGGSPNQRRPPWTLTRSGPLDRQRNLVEITSVQSQGRGTDPAVDLLR